MTRRSSHAASGLVLEAGVLDEILVSIVPLLLGDGVRMYDVTGGDRVRLERIARVAGGNQPPVPHRALNP
jgi:hypothetical protein